MNDKGYDSKEIILTILREEQERQISIKKLKRELQEIERQGDMRDTKRITEIIDELNIIDPLSENKEFAGEKNKEANPKKRRFMPLKISAVCIMILLSIQVVSVTSYNGNFFDSVYNWSKDMIVYMMGKEINEYNTDVSGSKNRTYTDIKTFQSQENLYIYIPESIDNNMVTQISYSFENEKSLSVNYESDYVLMINFHNVLMPNSAEDNRILYIHNNIEFLVNIDGGTIYWVIDGNLYILVNDFSLENYKEIIANIK